MSLRLPLAVACLLSTLASPAAGEVFKWVDADGVVTYGDRPPPNANKLRPLDEANARLSVVPGMPREEIERERERGLRRQLEQAQLEIEALRARPPTTIQVAPSPEDYPVYWTGYAAYPPYWRRGPVHGKPRPPHAGQLPVRGGPVKRTPPLR